jgi:hypothetical protein
MWFLLSLVPQKDEMDKNFSLLLNVARSLRYRTFEPIIGHELIVSRSDLIASESEALVGRFLDGCSFSSPEQGTLDGQIARYGLLDLRFQARATLLEKGYKTGIPLLKELGFLENGTSSVAEEDCILYCLEELLDGTRKNETYLMLFLQISRVQRADGSQLQQNDMPRRACALPSPMVFTVEDACISNSSFVWMLKHFYV